VIDECGREIESMTLLVVELNYRFLEISLLKVQRIAAAEEAFKQEVITSLTIALDL
jgi:hypothetical protein